MDVLPLERPLFELSNRIAELRVTVAQSGSEGSGPSGVGGTHIGGRNLHEEIAFLEQQFEVLAQQIYSGLTPYQVTQLSRHPNRPYTLDVVGQLCTDFIELYGDRNFMDDAAIVGGIGVFRGHKCVFVGHQKGRGTKDNLKRNFGMPRPEGYRKALRLMSLAERFNLPIVTFIDTPGAYPGKDAEERGQSEAIAKNIMVMFKLRVPIICFVLGEGGSGGALAIGVGDRVLMMQNSVYSVISPEGCASILWKDGSRAADAAANLGLTAPSALELGVIDEVIKEPLGAAHWRPKEAIERIGEALERHLEAQRTEQLVLLVALLTHTAPPGRRAEDYWSAAPAHPTQPRLHYAWRCAQFHSCAVRAPGSLLGIHSWRSLAQPDWHRLTDAK
jgi:acetyl-CoA carboxylase carboxyl transferase subunit alpha